ncbi:MAG: isoamylase early set domain-containing protein [Gemmatimonadales bacterium]
MPDETDPIIASIVTTLRAPVDLGPELERRVLARLATQPRPALRTRRRPQLLAWAAALAGLALFGAELARHRAPQLPVSPDPIRTVELTLSTNASSRVAVVGDFNNWDPHATTLTRRGERWSTTLRLRPGRYRYTFLVDGVRWVADPGRSSSADPDFDRPTSILTVSR